MRYHEIVREVFDKTPELVDIKQFDDEWSALFSVGESEYLPYAYTNDGREWKFEFRFNSGAGRYDDSYGNNGQSGGRASQVFAGAAQSLRAFIRAKNPLRVTFNGKKSLKKDALYSRMLHRMRDEINRAGYSLSEHDNGEDVEFTLARG